MKKISAGIFVILFIGCIIAVIAKYAIVSSTGQPLFLTSYLDNGKIIEAKEKALVKHELFGNVESYSGFLTINKTYNTNIFFWYFPSKSDPQNDPLVLWMNGGPGTSSLLGLFAENGPFVITENGSVEMREYSWHINHNIIFIDSPVGAGFSFTESNSAYTTSQEEVASDVVLALVQFFEIFPERQKNDFYVTGESYAGKVIISTSYAIKMYNKKSEKKINLKGLTMGSAWINPIEQISDYSNALYYLGIIDSHEREQVKRMEEQIYKLLKEEKYVEASYAFDPLFYSALSLGPSLFKNMTGYNYFFNSLQERRPVEINRYIDWIVKPDVRKAIHVGNYEYNASSTVVKHYSIEDFHKTAVLYLEELVEDYKVLIYCGTLDLLVSCVATERVVVNLNWSGADDYRVVRKKIWQVANDVAGYWKTTKNLNSVVVRNGGHFLPFDQPLWVWDMITRFTHNVRV